jgi:hypothetical protein
LGAPGRREAHPGEERSSAGAVARRGYAREPGGEQVVEHPYDEAAPGALGGKQVGPDESLGADYLALGMSEVLAEAEAGVIGKSGARMMRRPCWWDRPGWRPRAGGRA